MKKKTLLTLIAACLLTLGLGSCCCFDDWYDYGHHGYGYGYYDRGPGYHHGGGHHHHHGPNAEVAPQAE